MAHPSLKWPVYEDYQFSRSSDCNRPGVEDHVHGRITPVGNVVKYIDFSNEHEHIGMLADWMKVGNLKDLQTWMVCYGFPLMLPDDPANETVTHSSLQRINARNIMKQSSKLVFPITNWQKSPEMLLHQARLWKLHWQLLKYARDDVDRLEKRMLLLLQRTAIPGRPYELQRHNVSRATLSPQMATTEELIALSGRNIESLKQGFNPFPKQARMVLDAFRKADNEHLADQQKWGPYSIDTTDGDPRQMSGEVHYAFLDEHRNVHGLDENEYGNYLKVRVNEEWTHGGCRAKLRNVALDFITWWLNGLLEEINPAIELGRDFTCKPIWTVTTPFQAMALAFFKEATHTSRLTECGNPDCGVWYLPTRSHQTNCRRSTCRKYVTKQNKKRGGRDGN